MNYTTAGAWKNAFSKTVAADNKWHHVAATFDGDFLRAYFDGAMEGETRTEIPPRRFQEKSKILSSG